MALAKLCYNTTMPSVDEYLSNISAQQRAEYERIRKIVRQVVPEADEVISYGIPTFRYKGSYVLYFGAFKHHMSLFPGAPLAIADKLQDFKVSKGTIQFTADHPVPESIITEILRVRLADIAKK